MALTTNDKRYVLSRIIWNRCVDIRERCPHRLGGLSFDFKAHPLEVEGCIDVRDHRPRTGDKFALFIAITRRHIIQLQTFGLCRDLENVFVVVGIRVREKVQRTEKVDLAVTSNTSSQSSLQPIVGGLPTRNDRDVTVHFVGLHVMQVTSNFQSADRTANRTPTTMDVGRGICVVGNHFLESDIKMRVEAPFGSHFQFIEIEILFNEDSREAQHDATGIEFDFTRTVFDFNRAGQISETRCLPSGIR